MDPLAVYQICNNAAIQRFGHPLCTEKRRADSYLKWKMTRVKMPMPFTKHGKPLESHDALNGRRLYSTGTTWYGEESMPVLCSVTILEWVFSHITCWSSSSHSSDVRPQSLPQRMIRGGGGVELAPGDLVPRTYPRQQRFLCRECHRIASVFGWLRSSMSLSLHLTYYSVIGESYRRVGFLFSS